MSQAIFSWIKHGPSVHCQAPEIKIQEYRMNKYKILYNPVQWQISVSTVLHHQILQWVNSANVTG